MAETLNQTTVVQFTANGTQTNFNFNFLVLYNASNNPQYSVNVYVTLSGNQPDPQNDIVLQGTVYTVTGAGNNSGGFITFQPGFVPPANSIVTISRDVPNAITTEFADAQTFNGANLDSAIQNLMLCVQQNTTAIARQCLAYPVNSYNPNLPANNQIPILTDADNQVWMSQNGVIIPVVLQQPADVNTLRSQLASAVMGGDGAGLVGYYDVLNNVQTTVRAFLNNLTNSVDGIFVTGDIDYSLNPVAKNGWIKWVNGTIGSATSGATVYANAAAQALYVMLWNNYSNTACPVTGGRGANALADWNANKPLALPTINGSVLFNIANITSLGAYSVSPGLNIGEALHTMLEAELATHSHPGSVVAAYNENGAQLSSSGHLFNQADVSMGQTNLPTVTIAPDGSSTPFNVIQPSTGVYFYIKL